MSRIYQLDDLTEIELGIQGENASRTVKIDISPWKDMFPEATINIIVQRPTDDEMYIANTEVVDGIFKWQITNADVAFAGVGKAELRATEGDVIRKSLTFCTSVSPSIEGASPTPPPASQSWVDLIIEKANSVLGAEAREFYINSDGHLIEIDFDGIEHDLGLVRGGGDSGVVDDVKVDGVSVVSSGIANIDLSGKANASDVYTKQEVNTRLQTKAPLSDVNILFNTIGNVPETTTVQAEIDSLESSKENTSNKTTTISDLSTNEQYPSAKAVYDLFNSIVNGNEVAY